MDRALSLALGSRGLLETIRVLELARLQIEDALRDADRSVENLLDAVRALLRNSAGDGPGNLQQRERAARETRRVVHAMQFYDLLGQRIGHVHDGLAVLAELLESPAGMAASDDWKALHERIRSMSGNESDRRLLDAVVQAEKPSGIHAADCPPAAGAGELDLF